MVQTNNRMLFFSVGKTYMANLSYIRSQFSWMSIMCITFLQATTGTHTIISAYSSLLERRFCASQVQLNYLIVALDTGRLFGWFSSTAADYLPMWMILMVGLIFTLVGYGVQYMHFVHKVASLSYWHIILLNVVAGNSICWINTYCHLIVTRNFKDNLKTITAVVSSYSALGGKIYTSLAEGITGKKDSQNVSIYLLLRCLVPSIVGLAVTLLLSCPKLIHFGEPDIFPIVFVIAIATGAFALLESIAPPLKNVSPQLSIVVLVVVIVLPFAVPLAINASLFELQKWISHVMPKMSTMANKTNSQSVAEISYDEEKGGTIEKAGVQDEQVPEKQEVKVGDEHGLKELLTSLDFWLFFWVHACGIPLGMVYENNLWRISQSRGNCEVPLLLVLSSLFGFFGRVFSVTFNWCARERKLLSGPALIAFIMIPMPASFFLLTNDSNICLYISTSILGACSGAINVIAASTTSELFGQKNADVNQNIVLTSIPVGSLLFGHLAAVNYDKERGANYEACTGFNCYHKTFVMWGIISSVGTILSSVLYLRTQKFYSK